MFKGIDVSSWQENIDFKKVKESGIDFVMIRAGYGEDFEDEYFKQNVNNAKENGLKVGAYYFIYATDVESAKRNADNFINILSKFEGQINFPVACDFEYDSVNFLEKRGVTVTKKLVCDITQAFCERVEKAGYYTMLYSNQDYINIYYGDLIKRYDLWYAYWYDTKTRNCNMWQYSSKGKIAGINGNVDLDIAYIDFEKLIRDNNLNHLNAKPVTNKPTNTLSFNVGDKFIINEINGSKIIITKEG